MSLIRVQAPGDYQYHYVTVALETATPAAAAAVGYAINRRLIAVDRGTL